MIQKTLFLSFTFLLIINLMSCATESGMGVMSLGTTVISKPDEHTHVYEAKEKFILKAIAGVLKEKGIGKNVTIDQKNHRVDSDYVITDDWRTKTTARVKRINWKECEVTLAVTTEKKTKEGWEMHRLLGKDQYDNFFSVIDLRIYEEMSKVE